MVIREAQAVAQVELAPQEHDIAPKFSYHFIELEKTNLHYMICGDGPPLIMVPATISKIENWRALAQFMGQRFTVYFFELPGHGKSSPYAEPFSSGLVAATIEQFVDRLGYDKFSLMGFSFGGILALKALARLQHRIDKVIFISPSVSTRALNFSPERIWMLRRFVRALQVGRVRLALLRAIRSRSLAGIVAAFMRRIGKVEDTIPVHEVFQKVTDSTAEVLSYQMAEMLNFDLPSDQTFAQRCFLAMSVHDPLLHFDKTAAILSKAFPSLYVEKMYHPFHQPPRPPTFAEINKDFGTLLEYVSSAV